jgi:hypothetical protein
MAAQADFLDAPFLKAYNPSHAGVVRVRNPDREGCRSERNETVVEASAGKQRRSRLMLDLPKKSK